MAEVSSLPTTATAAAATQQATRVLCCVCGVLIEPNSSNTCASCLASDCDITRGISTEVTLHQCRGCQRWHRESGKWIACELESRELMSLCLSHISGLKQQQQQNQQQGGGRVRLVDAGWIWTEPHSMRLKVRLTVQREVQAGTILQQSFTVMFVVRNQQCVECQAEYRQGSWKSLVQVRQRVNHKRTFLYLEQLILKHDAHRGCLSVETFRDGMDFYFPDKGKASRFIAFLENVCPVQTKMSKKLISTDDKSNVSNFKYTNLVQICPLCKDDLLYLPSRTARNLGNISRLVLVKNISNAIHLIDPLTGQTASMTSESYWRDPIRPLVTAARSRMTRYVVLGKEPVFLRRNVSKRSANRRQRTRLASLTLAKERDLGKNDARVEERSHVGYLFKSGDVCVGYDLRDTQFIDDDAETKRERGELPDVVVLRKLYGGAALAAAAAAAAADNDNDNHTNAATTRKHRRIWKLRRLDVRTATEDDAGGAGSNKKKKKRRGAAQGDGDGDEDMDEEDFMQEVEADRDMRMNINLYKSDDIDRNKTEDGGDEDMDAAGDVGKRDGDEDGDDEDEDDQQIRLDELLDGLALESGPDADGDGMETGEFGSAAEAAAAPVGSARAEGERASRDGLGYIAREDARTLRQKEAAVPIRGGVMGKEFDAASATESKKPPTAK